MTAENWIAGAISRGRRAPLAIRALNALASMDVVIRADRTVADMP